MDAEKFIKEGLDFLLGPLIPTCIFILVALYSLLMLPVAMPLWWAFKISEYVESDKWRDRFWKALRVLSKPFEILQIRIGH